MDNEVHYFAQSQMDDDSVGGKVVNPLLEQIFKVSYSVSVYENKKSEYFRGLMRRLADIFSQHSSGNYTRKIKVKH